MSDAPAVLVLTSSGSEPNVVTPVLAALDVVGARVRAVNAGRLGGDRDGALDWVMRALGGEMEGERIEQEIAARPPDVAVCFDVGPAQALCELRDASSRPFPVVAVIGELAPSVAWAKVDVDRCFAVDDEAAVALEDAGMAAGSIVVVGGIGEFAFASAGQQARSDLRSRFKLQGNVVLVEVAGLGAEESSQLALQLSLVDVGATYLFDAGRDTSAAAALRAQVPVLGMKAKLFGDTDDAPLLWRSADVVVAVPSARSVSRASAVGALMVCFNPRGGADARRASAVEDREDGSTAANALMISTALESLLRRSDKERASAGLDGAGTVADGLYLIGSQRAEMLKERHSEAAESRQSQVADASEYAVWAKKAASPAGDLEDLGAASSVPPPPNLGNLGRLKDEIKARRAQAVRTVGDAQKQSTRWDAQRASADKLGNAAMAQKAERNADLERARMHSALAELAGLDAEMKGIEDAAAAAAKAPPVATPEPSRKSQGKGGGTSVHRRATVDEELERLRRKADSPGAPKARKSKKSRTKKRKASSAVDDELAALKRKLAQKRK